VSHIKHDSIEQSNVSEADISLAIQELARIVGKPKIRYLLHKSSHLIRILSQLNSVEVFSSLSFKFHFSFYLLLRLLLKCDLFPSGFLTKIFSCVCYIIRPSYSPWVDNCLVRNRKQNALFNSEHRFLSQNRVIHSTPSYLV